jgi:periplasmic divalent cation tolerance protein
MKTKSLFAIVMVTAPDLKTARKIARAVLAARLAACVNLLPGIESHYWWEGKLETGKEVLMLLKTRTARLAALEKFVLANHPYDTPEFVVLDSNQGNKRYLRWIMESVV